MLYELFILLITLKIQIDNVLKIYRFEEKDKSWGKIARIELDCHNILTRRILPGACEEFTTTDGIEAIDINLL